MSDLENLAKKFEDKLRFAPDFKAVVMFDFGDDGVIHVDASDRPAVVSYETQDADLVLILSKALLEEFMAGTKDPNLAYMTGKLKIRGSIPLALKLNSLLED